VGNYGNNDLALAEEKKDEEIASGDGEGEKRPRVDLWD